MSKAKMFPVFLRAAKGMMDKGFYKNAGNAFAAYSFIESVVQGAGRVQQGFQAAATFMASDATNNAFRNATDQIKSEMTRGYS